MSRNKITVARGTSAEIEATKEYLESYEPIYDKTEKKLGIKDGIDISWHSRDDEVVKLTGNQDNINGLKTFKKKVTIEEELAFKNNAYIEYDSGSKSIKFRFA